MGTAQGLNRLACTGDTQRPGCLWGHGGDTPGPSCVKATLWPTQAGDTPRPGCVGDTVGTPQGLAMLEAARAFLKPGYTGDAQRPGCVGTRRDSPGPGHAGVVVALGTRPSPQPAGAAPPALSSCVPRQQGQTWRPFGGDGRAGLGTVAPSESHLILLSHAMCEGPGHGVLSPPSALGMRDTCAVPGEPPDGCKPPHGCKPPRWL